MSYISTKLIKAYETFLINSNQIITVDDTLESFLDFALKQLNSETVLIDFAKSPTGKFHDNRKLYNFLSHQELELTALSTLQEADKISEEYNNYFIDKDPYGKILFQRTVQNLSKFNLFYMDYANTNFEFFHDFLKPISCDRLIICTLKLCPGTFVRSSVGRSSKLDEYTKGEMEILSLIGTFVMNHLHNIITLINIDEESKKKDKQIDLLHAAINQIEDYSFIFDEALTLVLINTAGKRFIDEIKSMPIQLETIDNIQFPVQIAYNLKNYIKKQVTKKTELKDYTPLRISLLPKFDYKVSITTIIPENNTNNKLYFMLRIVPTQIKSKLMQLKHIHSLSNREYEVVHNYVCNRLNGQQIANAMGITVNTVDNYFKSILFKMGILSRKDIFLLV